MDLDLDLPLIDDDVGLPDVEAVPKIAPQAPDGSGILDSALGVHQEQEPSESVEAPLLRKRRAPKVLPVDERQELHNADLAQWKVNYLGNMAEAIETKASHKAPFLAKKNAAFWVTGAGIGGVGAGLGSSKLQSPLDNFAGDAIMEALTGVQLPTAGQKRGRDEEEDHDSDSEARRVRTRDGDGDKIGRGDDRTMNDERPVMMLASDVSISTIAEVFSKLIISRESKLAVMLRQRSKIHPCLGISAQLSALVKTPLHVVVDLPAALAVSLQVVALLALCNQSEVRAHRIDAPVASPAPVLSWPVGASVTAVLKILRVKMITSFLLDATSLMTKRLTTSNFMVPLPP